MPSFADLIGGGGGHANRLRVHHLAHHGPARRCLVAHIRSGAQVELLRGDALQASEQSVRGSIAAGQPATPKPADVGAEKGKEPAQSA